MLDRIIQDLSRCGCWERGACGADHGSFTVRGIWIGLERRNEGFNWRELVELLVRLKSNFWTPEQSSRTRIRRSICAPQFVLQFGINLTDVLPHMDRRSYIGGNASVRWWAVECVPSPDSPVFACEFCLHVYGTQESAQIPVCHVDAGTDIY